MTGISSGMWKCWGDIRDEDDEEGGGGGEMGVERDSAEDGNAEVGGRERCV